MIMVPTTAMIRPRRLWLLLFWTIATITATMRMMICEAGIPTEPEFFPLQLVDHNRVSSSSSSSSSLSSTFHYLRRPLPIFWKQRFYRNSDHFQGPGHPILLVLGGEGAIPPSVGIFYPVVVNVYAKAFGALVLEPEHRFYGVSQPIHVRQYDHHPERRPDPRITLLTAEQALHDAMRLTRHIQASYGCSLDRTSAQYCPVIAIGGSYPGFLAAMARLRFPDVIDMGYAASAPMKFYAQQVNQYEYYHHITKVAETAVPGCAAAVQQTLNDLVHLVRNMTTPQQLIQTSHALGVCPRTVPPYMLNNAKTFVDEIMMVIGYTFANHNMAHYPPSNQTSLSKSCAIFKTDSFHMFEKLNTFLIKSLASHDDTSTCFDLSQQLPAGPQATLSGGDWSGVGSGTSGESWDYQTCTLLVEAIGFAGSSDLLAADHGGGDMFPPRPWSLDWLTQHCQTRFGVTPRPHDLAQAWGFGDLVRCTNASHILFTNGLNDGWSVSGIQQNLSDTLVALNFPNGAHHSDLWGRVVDQDTPDIVDGVRRIQQLLGTWLEELPSYRLYHRSAVVQSSNSSSNNVSKEKDEAATTAMTAPQDSLLIRAAALVKQ